MWVVYILECNDGSLYTGITNNLDKRISAHNTGKGAKYTRNKRPVALRAYWEVSDRSEASKEEYRIKKLTRKQKLKMIQDWGLIN